MNKKKLQQIFDMARNETAPAPPADFAADVLRASRQEPLARQRPPFSLFDQLNVLFPRVALAALAVILLCAAAELVSNEAGWPDLSNGVVQVSSQFLFNSEGM